MRLLKIQPEVNGEWFVAGVIPYNGHKPHITVYDTDYEYLNVTVGHMKKHTKISDPEAETLTVLMGIPILTPDVMYYIPDSHWAVELWSP
jgi:hypothetical protein